MILNEFLQLNIAIHIKSEKRRKSKYDIMEHTVFSVMIYRINFLLLEIYTLKKTQNMPEVPINIFKIFFLVKGIVS